MQQSKSKEGDYKAIREAVAAKLETDDYDDGRGPARVFVEH